MRILDLEKDRVLNHRPKWKCVMSRFRVPTPTILATALLGLCFVFAMAQQADASCLQKGGDKGALKEAEFHPEKNDTITLLYWLEGVSTCYNRVPMPQGYDVIEASIENHPSRGTVTQIDKNVFKYTKNSGHLGMDQYSVRVCAKKRFGTTGCTLIRYNMNSIMGKQGQMERPE